MCNKAVDNYPHPLKFEKMCDKAVDTYPSTKKIVSECYKTQQMRQRAVHKRFFIFHSVPEIYKTQD